jgi:flagellar biosynthetic protein FliP
MNKRWLGVLSAIVMLFGLAVQSAMAADPFSMPALNVVSNDDGTQSYSVTLQVVILMTMLSFLPAIVMMMTAFTRIIIVFGILRQAMGLQQTPSNQILIGLALFLTVFVMAPVFEEVNKLAIQPYMNEELGALEAAQAGSVPFRKFMLAQTRETDLNLFVELAHDDQKYASLEEVPLIIVIPAFVTSELKTAFQIGFLLFIPFLIIDLVVASVLMAMGMMMLSPMIVSLPFKIMLFVFIDGWAMVVATVASSFGL